MAMRNREDDGMITKVVSINRVSKTVKGDRKSTRLNSSHNNQSRMPSSA